MKKLIALLMALLMVATMMTTAMAYEAVTPAGDFALVIPHTLTLTKDNLSKLPYDITYNFAVKEVKIMQPDGVPETKYGSFVTGTPSIAPIEYTTDDTFTDLKCIKNTVINWGTGDNAVKFYEPGVYRWRVEKSVKTEAADYDENANPSAPSNTVNEFYVYVVVAATDDQLTVTNVNVTTDEDLEEKFSELQDQYPAKMVNLEITKSVDGTQASRNQYFKFSVVLQSPPSADVMKYTIDTSKMDVSVPATAYNDPTTNVTTVEVTSNEPKTITLWLKHGQTATITNMLYGTSYSVVEVLDDADYTTKVAISGDTTDIIADNTKRSAEDKSLHNDAVVAFTNTKNAKVPTGIDLQTTAPIVCLLMAMGLMFVAFAGKRKEEIV